MQRRIKIDAFGIIILSLIAVLGSGWLIRSSAKGRTDSDVSLMPHRKVGAILGCSRRLSYGGDSHLAGVPQPAGHLHRSIRRAGCRRIQRPAGRCPQQFPHATPGTVCKGEDGAGREPALDTAKVPRPKDRHRGRAEGVAEPPGQYGILTTKHHDENMPSHPDAHASDRLK